MQLFHHAHVSTDPVLYLPLWTAAVQILVSGSHFFQLCPLPTFQFHKEALENFFVLARVDSRSPQNSSL